MLPRKVRQILQCARMQLQAGNERRAASYYARATRALERSDITKANAQATRDIEAILGAGYVATVLW